MKKYRLFLLSLFCSCGLVSQTIDIQWSEQLIYDNKKDGFFDSFVGSNDSYVYAKFSDLKFSSGRPDKKIKLLAFDKSTMKKAGEAALKGYGGATDREPYVYFKTVAVKDMVYVFWTKTGKSEVEVYVQSFDTRLKSLNGLKKVYEVNRSTKTVTADKLFILSNNDLGGLILLAKEFGTGTSDEHLRLEYKLMQPDFSTIAARQVTLPILVKKKAGRLFTNSANALYALSCEYELGVDGNLYVQDMVRMSPEEKQGLRRSEASVYPTVMQVQLASGNVASYNVKFPGKNSFNTSLIVTTRGVKLYGFFSDLSKDEKGRDAHGLFYVNVSNGNFAPLDTKFSYFTKGFLDELYSADKENQKKGRGWFKSEKAKASDEESIDDNYVIEEVHQEGDDILLFCSIMNNWTSTVCTNNGNVQNCTTEYHCTKNNVTTFRLDRRGDIVWAKNLDRSITYNRWDVYDLTVMKKDMNYYVVYGSAYQINTKKKNRRSRKSGEQLTDRLEYAVFNGESGNFQRYEKQINPINVRKSARKSIDPSAISTYDGKMYVPTSRHKLKPAVYFACLCPPVFLALIYSGNSRIGTGYIGTIAPLN